MPIPFPAPAQAAGNLRGIGQMLLAGLFFAAMHAAVRHVANTGLHPFEIAFFRNLFGLLVVLPWVFRYGLAVLRTSRLDLHALRATVNTLGMLAGFYAFTIAPLSQVTALGFSGPIFATLFAIMFLGEKVGLRRWSAILFGFLGTLVAVGFGLGGIQLGAWLAIAGAVSTGVSIVTIKVLGRSESAITITAYMSLLMAPVSLFPSLLVWSWPDWVQLVWLVGIGVSGNIGQILMVQALHNGDTNVVMPIDYLRLLWVSAIAFFAFAEVPDNYTWAGGTMIFASAAYIAYRERKLSGRKTAPAPRPDDQSKEG